MFVWGSKESRHSTSGFVSEDLSNDAKDDDGARCSAAARVAGKGCLSVDEQNITVLACGGKGREMLMGVYRHTYAHRSL